MWLGDEPSVTGFPDSGVDLCRMDDAMRKAASLFSWAHNSDDMRERSL